MQSVTKPVGSTILLVLAVKRRGAAIDFSTVIRVKALSSYSKLYFSNGKVLVVSKVLRWFEEALAENFMRIHRTHLVNKSFIDEYMADGRIRLHTGECIEVSRRKRNSVKIPSCLCA
jgi:two-component system, LytTR family, response regulator